MSGALAHPAGASTGSLRDRWLAGEPQVGIFTRFGDAEVYELVSRASVDFVVLDVEHGSFDRASLSRCVFAARAGGLATLVRVADPSLPAIQHVVGTGADGIIVPHWTSIPEIAAVAAFVRGAGAERAHAGATRAAQFRDMPWSMFRERAGQLLLLAQIDDPPGIADAPSLAEVDGLDGAFLGRISLALALGGDEAADIALERVCAAFVARGRLLGLSLTDGDRASHWVQRGVGLFAIDSDQRLLLGAIRARLQSYRSALTAPPEGPPERDRTERP